MPGVRGSSAPSLPLGGHKALRSTIIGRATLPLQNRSIVQVSEYWQGDYNCITPSAKRRSRRCFVDTKQECTKNKNNLARSGIVTQLEWQVHTPVGALIEVHALVVGGKLATGALGRAAALRLRLRSLLGRLVHLILCLVCLPHRQRLQPCYQYLTRFSCQMRRGASADKLQVNVSKTIPLVVIARSKQDAINRGHDAK